MMASSKVDLPAPVGPEMANSSSRRKSICCFSRKQASPSTARWTGRKAQGPDRRIGTVLTCPAASVAGEPALERVVSGGLVIEVLKRVQDGQVRRLRMHAEVIGGVVAGRRPPGLQR